MNFSGSKVVFWTKNWSIDNIATAFVPWMVCDDKIVLWVKGGAYSPDGVVQKEAY